MKKASRSLLIILVLILCLSVSSTAFAGNFTYSGYATTNFPASGSTTVSAGGTVADNNLYCYGTNGTSMGSAATYYGSYLSVGGYGMQSGQTKVYHNGRYELSSSRSGTVSLRVYRNSSFTSWRRIDVKGGVFTYA